MALQLVSGTVEILPVTVRDLTGIITTLDGTTPTFYVNSVDPDTEVETPQVTSTSCVNSGMMLQPLIDTTSGGGWDAGKYRMYVSFTVGDGEVPVLGPFEFFIV